MKAESLGEQQITADDLFNALTVRYDAPWVLKREVTLNTRRIDVVAFGMPGSTGCRIIAFELKVSRSDWLRELANFRKSEAWMAEADAFILVTTPGIVQPGELPARWGHLEFTGKQLRTKAHAEYRDHRGEMSRELAMRIIRSAHLETKEIVFRERAKMEHDAREKIKAQLEESQQRETHQLREELASARKELAAIYEAFGVQRRIWDSDARLLRCIGMLADALEKGGQRHVQKVLANLRDEFADKAQRMTAALEALRGPDEHSPEGAPCAA